MRNMRSSINDNKQVRGKSSLDKMFHNEILSPTKRHDDYIKVGSNDISMQSAKTI